jgi:peptidoglycan/LPS O-acetylase OafA/YrhL
MSTATATTPEIRIAAASRFYRPEIDALRFFAFLGVFVHHGPTTGGAVETFHSAGGFGLSMFFLLSAFLITELLLRERDQTNTVAWRLFFTRRALRIWPLYFSAIAVAYLFGHMSHGFSMSRHAVIVMALFTANWTAVAPSLGLLIGHLWTISVEEQFYLIWPPVIKFGGRKAAFMMSSLFLAGAAIWVYSFANRGWLLWYATPVEFLFFAAGALIALGLKSGALAGAKPFLRSGLILLGCWALWIAAAYGRVETFPAPGLVTLSFRYVGAMTGCVLIFLGVLGLPFVPRVLIYLGKISYGLYVFHLAAFQLAYRLTAPLHLLTHTIGNLLVVDCSALILTALFAALSYQYFERPFMRIKERFAVIPSRPA